MAPVINSAITAMPHSESVGMFDAGQAALTPLHLVGPHDGFPGEPAGLGLHVPTKPATLHASHEPPHAALQHTPSTQ
jgi:hypothetical protein